MINVVLIEDDPVARLGSEAVLRSDPDINLLGASATVEAATSRHHQAVDLVLLDLRLRGGGLTGRDAVERLVNLHHNVLILSMKEDARSVLDAIEAGAKGYLTKEAEPGEILRAVRAVAAGKTYFSATVAGFLLRQGVTLTRREIEVLRLMAEGETSREIGKLLSIEESTVNGHLDRIRNKTGMRRRPDLTRFALREGIAGNE